MAEDKKDCMGCDGKGWVQVIDPPVYTFGAGSSAGIATPAMIGGGTARAAVCPLCCGSGRPRGGA